MNNFDKIAQEYVKVNFKPDRVYSMLPTLLSILNLTPSSKVVDVGCGEGFFTVPIAKNALKVIGIDISIELLKIATPAHNIEYICADMFDFDYPLTDRISCPYVLNYTLPLEKLTGLFRKFYGALKKGGKIASILDSPKSQVHDNREFGSIKKVNGPIKEGSIIEIELYNENKLLVTFQSIYHERRSIEGCLTDAGFNNIYWKEVIVSREGIQNLGTEYWERYKRNCDVAYLVAEK